MLSPRQQIAEIEYYRKQGDNSSCEQNEDAVSHWRIGFYALLGISLLEGVLVVCCCRALRTHIICKCFKSPKRNDSNASNQEEVDSTPLNVVDTRQLNDLPASSLEMPNSFPEQQNCSRSSTSSVHRQAVDAGEISANVPYSEDLVVDIDRD
ncbi:uncharacterized protein LOC125660727 [Ostrea edulis]|uniref:uncharacterized protein LOC125660727 n=1 Tax=Ostrea edulis TaxID=37623 RepID=UPI0024AEFBCF|nr:uncharacterized protein LOC125660727 [Ostrea edulis]